LTATEERDWKTIDRTKKTCESLCTSLLPYFKSTSASLFYLSLFFMLEMIQDIKDNLVAENVLILQWKGKHRV